MALPHSQPDTLAALAAMADELAAFFAAIPDTRFFSGDAAHWGPAHHLGHLQIAHARIGKAFRVGAAMPAHPTGASRPYDAVREAYLAALATAPPAFLANNPMTPSVDPAAGRDAAVAGFVDADRRMREAAATWSEAEWDARAIPHPVMGPLTAREMLFFCHAHDRHHLEGVRRALAAG